MKIKYLKIRNIASIERGDIDFENGLLDSESGKQSSLFLITGDTGSGKSVILDCISMALYGTTPRVKSVNGVKNNVFKNNDGQEISVSNINQYTRIGISAKDDCYSELIFVGNDGVEYTSRFTLGKTNRNNLKKPEWTLIANGRDNVETKKKDVAERIEKAVGLTFEQFSRMAMLAQGQFATFLTGSKEEREVILEQLTATDIFSRYGEAISNLYKNAKQEKELSAKLFEEYGKNILSDEIRTQLQEELKTKRELASGLLSETKRIRDRITHTEAVLKAEKDIEALKRENGKLKAEEDSPEFKKALALLCLWDKTENERKFLSNKLEATQRVASDMRKLKEMKRDFSSLGLVLNNQRERSNEQTLSLEEERIWLEQNEPLRKIFNDASVTILKITNYLTLLNEFKHKRKMVDEGKDGIRKFAEEVGKIQAEEKDKSEACESCQQMIAKKSEERDAINPTLLRKKNEKLLNRKHAIIELSSLFTKANKEKEETEKASKELSETAKILAGLKESAESSASKLDLTEKRMKEAEQRYMTMHLSVDKNFKELRSKLAKEHAENCPLCGQSITDHLSEWSTEGYFAGLLTPLEEEKKKCKEAFLIAKRDSEEAVKKLNRTEGMLRVKESDLKNKKKGLKQIEADIKECIRLLDLTDIESPAEYIEKELSAAISEIEIVSEKLIMAEKIQKEIDELIKQKDILDKKHRDADSLLQESMRNLTKMNESVKNVETRIEELKLEIKSLQGSITEALKGYADDWQSNPSAIAARLKNDADEYTYRSSKYAKDRQAHDTLIKSLDSLLEIQDQLSELFSDIEGDAMGVLSPEEESLGIEMLGKKWNEFLIEASTVVNRWKDNESKIKELEKKLNESYLASGLTETTLKQLLGAAKDVTEARSLQQKNRDNLNKNSTLLSEAIRSKEEHLRELNLKEGSEIENPAELQASLDSQEKQQGEITQQLGVIKERLDSDEKMRMETERQRADLEQKTLRYEKWEKMNRYFGGTRFRTLVQSHILRPLLDNANIYLRQITDHYTLSCSDENEQLSILVLDRYHNNEPRSVTVLSGGERFMISLALSLALSAMNRPDLNVDILFIDEGFGTLDARSLEMVMNTLRRLPEINGQTGRRVGVISHREELTEQIPTQIRLRRSGEGRSRIVISNS